MSLPFHHLLSIVLIAVGCLFGLAYIWYTIEYISPRSATNQRKRERQKLKRWQRYTSGGQGPEEIVDRYAVFVPEKMGLDSGAVRFECQLYRWLDDLHADTPHSWHRGDWSVEYDLDQQQAEGRLEDQIWPAGTPMETLAEAWADYSRQIRELNERRYAQYLAAQQQRQEKDEAAALVQKEKEKLLESARQITALLPDLTGPEATNLASPRR